MNKQQVSFPVYPAQVSFADSPANIRGFVGGIGSGKSHIGAYDLAKRAKGGRLYMVTAPTYPMLRDATFRSFKEVTQAIGTWIDGPEGMNKTEFRAIIRAWTGGLAEVLFRSTDFPDGLRGPNLSGVWMDEASLSGREAFDVLIGRLRQQGEQGWLSATFTPKGKQHWTYDLFGKAGDGIHLTHAKTGENPFLPAGFAERVALRYGSLRRLQELEGMFVTLEGAEWPPEYFEGDSLWFGDWPAGLRLRVMALDPSTGKNTKTGDYSAFVMLGVDREGSLWVDADLERRPAERMVSDGVDLMNRFRPDAFGLETNSWQFLLEPMFREEFRRRNRLPADFYAVENSIDKRIRIRRIGRWLAERKIHFRQTPGAELLFSQLSSFPDCDHDDGPDALEMAIRLARDIMPEAFPGDDDLPPAQQPDEPQYMAGNY